MNRNERFTFLVTREERQLIAALANRLQRSQSDAVRFLVRGAAQELGVIQAQRKQAGRATGQRESTTNGSN